MSTYYPVSPAEPRTNTFFAIEPQPGAAFINPFRDTRRVTLDSADSAVAGVEVLAGSSAHVERLYDAASGCCVYCWGQIAHAKVQRVQLLAWMLDVAQRSDQSALREVMGVFMVLIDDRRRARVLMISDTMGLRPWFVGQNQGRLVCGSDVWMLQGAGIDMGGVNYDAVASFLRYQYDCTGQSLFAGFTQIGYGTVGTWQSGRYSESQYATFSGANNKPSVIELVEGMHARVSRAFDALTRDLDHVTVALSGGYDSRYLAALAVEREHLKVEAFSVRDREAEGEAATMVGDALGLTLGILRTDGTRWNLYEEPIHFASGGFPITKQVSHLAASQRPGVPCLNGFIGDPIVRGTLDRANGKLPEETTEDFAVSFQRVHRLKAGEAKWELIDERIVQRADERTLAVWQREMPRWSHTQHPFVATSFFTRQRSYIANNFLEHMHVAEAILPFTSWEVIEYKFQNDATCYTWETYEALFKRFYPRIAHVPHNKRMQTTNAPPVGKSRVTNEWAARVIKGVLLSGGLSLIVRRKSLPRLASSIVTSRYQVEALFLHRLYMLEARLRTAGIPFAWEKI